MEQKNLVFFSRAELTQVLDLADKYHMTRNDKNMILNSYLKAYVTGIIDNLDYISEYVDSPESHNKIVGDLYELKHRAYKEWQEY